MREEVFNPIGKRRLHYRCYRRYRRRRPPVFHHRCLRSSLQPPSVVGARRHRRQRRGGDDCIDGAAAAAAASCEFQLWYLTLPTRIFPQIPTVYVGVRWYQFREMVILNLCAMTGPAIMRVSRFLPTAIARAGVGDYLLSPRLPQCHRIIGHRAVCVVVVSRDPAIFVPGRLLRRRSSSSSGASTNE